MPVEMNPQKVDEMFTTGYKCRDCKSKLGNAKFYDLEFWQWLVLVAELGWVISPEIVEIDSEGNEIARTEGYNLCDTHRKGDN